MALRHSLSVHDMSVFCLSLLSMTLRLFLLQALTAGCDAPSVDALLFSLEISLMNWDMYMNFCNEVCCGTGDIRLSYFL